MSASTSSPFPRLQGFHAWPLLAALAMLLASALAAGCGSDTAVAETPTQPVSVIPAQARGHYCGMYLSEHAGPKGQIRVRDLAAPLWFTSIREVFSFLSAPDEPKAVTGVYVQDMGHRQTDGGFGPDAWIDARTAWYVIGSATPGPAEADDAVPFARRDQAEAFRAAHGGRVVSFAAMPDTFVRAGSADTASSGDTPAQGAAS